MDMYLSGIISILASFQLLFVAIYIFAYNKGDRPNNILLGILFLLFSISLGDFAIRISGIIVQHKFLHLIDDGFFFLYGPLLYFYVRGVIYSDLKLQLKHIIHLIPFISYIGFLIFSIATLDSGEQDQMAKTIYTGNLPAWMYVSSISIYLYNMIYIWLAYKSVKTYSSVIKNKFSSLHEINLNWLKFIIQSFGAITIIAMVHNIVPILGNVFLLYITLIFLLLYTFYFINRVLLKALQQPNIFAGIELKEANEKYAGSTLKVEEIEKLYANLTTALEDKKLFLNSEITLQNLAELLGTSSKELSQVINQRSAMNFFDFINSYRCEEVKAIMAESDPKVTVLEMMYQAGFNSKSSFNKEFKKLNGKTPTEYRKSIKSG